MNWQLISKTKDLIQYSNGTEFINLELIYEHSELGNFYKFSNSSDIPYQRKYILDVVIQNENLGLNKKEILELLEQSMNYTKQGDTHNAFSVQNLIKQRVTDQWSSYHSNMLVAAAFIVSENENISTFNQQIATEKINLWTADPKMTSFFLSMAQNLTAHLMNGLTSISKDALREVEKQNEVPTLLEGLSK
ncbi:MAG: hypothetical protein ACEQSR_16515 [Candidatus Methylacidiphilales bacterium]